MAQDISCIYSTIRNTSGGRKKFSFLPPHGRELVADEEFTVFGNIYEAVIKFDRVTSRRHITALEAALKRGDLEIVSTPAPVFEDGNGRSRVLAMTGNGTITAVDPCWASSVG